MNDVFIDLFIVLEEFLSKQACTLTKRLKGTHALRRPRAPSVEEVRRSDGAGWRYVAGGAVGSDRVSRVSADLSISRLSLSRSAAAVALGNFGAVATLVRII